MCDDFFRDNFLPEVSSDVISGTAVEVVDLDVSVEFGYSRSKAVRVMRTTHSHLKITFEEMRILVFGKI